MRIGDLVTLCTTYLEPAFGVIVDFKVIYDRYGDPREKFAIVNWGDDFPNEEEYLQDIRVVNDERG